MALTCIINTGAQSCVCIVSWYDAPRMESVRHPRPRGVSRRLELAAGRPMASDHVQVHTCTVYTVQTVVWYWYEYILVYIRYVQRAACKNYTVQRHRRGPDTGGTTKFMEYMIWKRRENTREATPARHNARLCLRLAGRPKCVPGGGHVLVGNHPSERDELTRALG